MSKNERELLESIKESGYGWMINPKYRYTIHRTSKALYVASEGYTGRFEPGPAVGNEQADSPFEAAKKHLLAQEGQGEPIIDEVSPLDYNGKQGVWHIAYHWSNN